MNSLLQDLRYGARMLRKQPGFTLIAVLTLALGIGANTAIFSIVNAVLLRPLMYKDADRLAFLFHYYPQVNLEAGVSAPGFVFYREHCRGCESLAAYASWEVDLTGRGEPERLRAKRFTASFFDTVGIKAAHGRLFTADEEQAGRHQVVVLSNGLWQRRFGGEESIIGQTITLNGAGYSVIGITPPGFEFGGEVNQPVELFAPLVIKPEQLAPTAFNHEFLTAITKLKPGVRLAQAQSELDALAGAARRQFRQNETWGLKLKSVKDEVLGDVRPALLILLAAVGALLLIACANVANLLLARAATRQKEMAVRTALGASRWRVIRQLLTESTLLAVAGGSAGLLLAVWGLELLVKFIPQSLPRVQEINLDSRVLLFTLLVSLLTGILFGLAPAFLASKIELTETLKEGRHSGSAGMKRSARQALLVAEMAIAIVLLVATGLLVCSFARLQQVNPGFRADHTLTMRLLLPNYKYRDPAAMDAFYQQLIQRIKTLPGVESAAAVSQLPLSGEVNRGSFTIEGRERVPGEADPHGDRWTVTTDYFQTLGIRLFKGRYFDERDTADAPAVTMIDETLAQKYFPHEDPVGKRLNLFEGKPDQPKWREIVGVVGQVKYTSLEQESYPQYYLPQHQRPRAGMFLVVRASTAAAALLSPVREAIRAADSDLPVFRVALLEERVAESLAQRHFGVMLLSVFAALALLLAAVGLYGVMSYAVAQRTHEIGIRMALGAETRDVLRLVIRQGMTLALLGVGIGVAGALALTRWLKTLLFGVSATDPLTFALVALLLMAVALLACWIPARRAAKVDPMIALRCD